MEKREVIEITVKNILNVYNDISGIAQIIDEKLKARRHMPIGDRGITWETSTAIDDPTGWLHKWFARVYNDPKNEKKGVGYCIHLGGYPDEQLDVLNDNGIAFPFMTLGVVQTEKPILKWSRPDLLNLLWGAGWFFEHEHEYKEKIFTTKGSFGSGKADVIGYFVDILELNSGDTIRSKVIDPILEIYNCNTKYLADRNTPVIASVGQ